ncbi:4-alpha-glucanotransferase [Luteimonas sp. FCS-9]|uniref:4-alpha-glucanotransferase n=1 Tax=Luteimonas sp. FCS-9 TaxID=1547516 RepID=UPI00063E91FB|nr:4-alpha-glucanotransferase [Luteimonas sp. FCS-9]KLI99440.1 4-alpha-glucanotransferase [Luteimonas sp. FCS-9]
MSAALHALADAAGLCRAWEDASGRARIVDDDALRAILAALGLRTGTAADIDDARRACAAAGETPAPLATAEAGQVCRLPAAGAALVLTHEDGGECVVAVEADGRATAPWRPGDWRYAWRGRTHTLAVAPTRCFGVADALGIAAPRAWGVGLQVYGTRAPGDGGVGDAAGVLDWAQRVAAAGGDALALSPVHAARPPGDGYSPYSPSDRRFLDPVHAAPALVLGDATVHTLWAEAGLDATGDADADLVDWPAAAGLRWRRLRLLRAARDRLPDAARASLAHFEHAGGAALEAFAAHAAADFGGGDPSLHRFAQWLAADSWDLVQHAARERGMGLGLIADLAVGFDPAGAEAAACPDAVLQGLELGAPPDAFNADGQVWGVTGYAPGGLRRSGFAPFRALLDATMRGRGGIRIDHILGLMRLWVVPRGAPSSAGAYLRCPLDDLLNLVVLASWRHRCIVIGEDLGVVPPGIRDTLARRGVLGIDVLPFTRDADGAFLPPARWRREAVATTTTHDLPTLAGWARGRDLDWRVRLGSLTPADERAQRQARAADVAALDAACAQALGTTGPAAWSALVAASPAPLALLPAEDALGLDEQPNLPGTVDTHPNWRRRLPAADVRLDAALAAFDAARRTA